MVSVQEAAFMVDELATDRHWPWWFALMWVSCKTNIPASAIREQLDQM